MTSTMDKRIAVLIDAENIRLDTLQSLFDQLPNDIGRVVINRAYADWSKVKGQNSQLLELGIEPVHHLRVPNSGKNAIDILLTIDAIDLLHESPIDVFVIVSADSDFIPLVRKLHAAGKEVWGAGLGGAVSQNLAKLCDRYFPLEKKSKAQSQKPVLSTQDQAAEDPKNENWGVEIDQAWSGRAPTRGDIIPGPKAATDAARVLQVSKLKSSSYKTLQKLLESSSLLSKNWRRNENAIIRQ